MWSCLLGLALHRYGRSHPFRANRRFQNARKITPHGTLLPFMYVVPISIMLTAGLKNRRSVNRRSVNHRTLNRQTVYRRIMCELVSSLSHPAYPSELVSSPSHPIMSGAASAIARAPLGAFARSRVRWSTPVARVPRPTRPLPFAGRSLYCLALKVN